MGTIATKGAEGTSFDPAPAGSHRGVCIWVVDLGTQKNDFQGEISYPHKVLLGWELSDEEMSDGRPFMVSEEFTLSLNEKANLLKFLNSWRGRPFTDEELAGWDVASLLGVPALVNVMHKLSKAKQKPFAKVMAATPLPKGMTKPTPRNDLIHYQIEDGPPPAGLPNWVVEKIARCEENQKKGGGGAVHAPEYAGVGGAGGETDLSEVPF